MNSVMLTGQVNRKKLIDTGTAAFTVFTLVQHVSGTRKDGSKWEFSKYHDCIMWYSSKGDGINDGDMVFVGGELDSRKVTNGDGSDVVKTYEQNGQAKTAAVYSAQIKVNEMWKTEDGPKRDNGKDDSLPF